MSDKDFCCEFVEYCEIKDVSSCEIWKRNKNIDEFEKAKSELKSELSKPFIKILDWLEKILDKKRRG
jgi:hypothetical protein